MRWQILLPIICLSLLTTIGGASRGDAPEAAAPGLLVQTVWMHINGEWQYPPPDDDHPAMDDYGAASATLLRFSENGEFSLIYCWIYEGPGFLAIGNGDGRTIYIGSWNPTDKGIETKFRLVFEMIQPVGGGKYPGPEETGIAVVADDTVQFQGKTFKAAPTLDFEEYELTIGPARIKSCGPEEVTFEVNAGDGSIVQWASATLRGRTSEFFAATTNVLGRTCISKTALLSPDAVSLEFCKYGYHCGAIQLSKVRDIVPGMESSLMVLAPRLNKHIKTDGSPCPAATDSRIRVEDPEGKGIPEASLYLLDRGELLVGATDSAGEFCLPNRRAALMACHIGFFCGLLQVEDFAAPEGSLVLSLAGFATPK